MLDIKKIDIINDAYTQMRISGLTVAPEAEENILALNRLESMMYEFEGRDICIGYFFESKPQVNSSAGILPKFKYCLSVLLANRLLMDFGKTTQTDAYLMKLAKGQYSFLLSQVEQTNAMPYPSRQPLGSGNKKWRGDYYRRYFPETLQIETCKTKAIYWGDTKDCEESFDAYLNNLETVSQYELTAGNALTVLSESLSSPVVSYRVKAENNNVNNITTNSQVKITVTTSLGRIQTRIINFNILSAIIE